MYQDGSDFDEFGRLDIYFLNRPENYTHVYNEHIYWHLYAISIKNNTSVNKYLWKHKWMPLLAFLWYPATNYTLINKNCLITAYAL